MSLRLPLFVAAALVVGAGLSPASAQPAYCGEEPMVQAPSAPPPDQMETPLAPPGATRIRQPGHRL